MQTQNYELFLRADVSSYIGEWIAICDGKIVAHSNNVKEVLSKANAKCPGKKPLIARIPDKETMIF
ncbi:succinyl-CoA synthetase subunit alpha [Candidatus Pacearchaeota archaeon]|nr:succinyl-CoA synthetase subunit alpha [Candidatus Pacearchaeota archaeon]